MDAETSFGRWLRQRRRVLDLTQEELARQALCSVGTIRKIEANERRPSKAITNRLADCLEITAAERSAFIVFARTALSSTRRPTQLPGQPPPGQLLGTKLFIPRTRPTLVPRPRLLALLNARLRSRLTLIAAPAGFGKTTLLSDWLHRVGRPTAWLALDAEDNDLSVFLRYLVAALQTIAPAIGSAALALLQAPQPPAPETLVTTLLNELSGASGEAAFPSSILVLDDYHIITTPSVQRAMSFLAEHLPPQLHLVIATRADPNLPLARLRTRGQLSELRADLLRFTAEEVRIFLTELMGLPLSAADVSVLEARTEGWVAGLQLAALALQDHADRDGFVQTFSGSNRYVLDYLVEEVFTGQPPHVQTFLLQTSILDRLCGPLCDAVLGLTTDHRPPTTDIKQDKETRSQAQTSDANLLVFPSPYLSVAASSVVGRRSPALSSSKGSVVDSHSQLLLEHLERANLFLIPLDDERRWYRYHHLFSEVLRQRLASDGRGASTADLHCRASAWYEQQGLIAEALQHALAAGANDQAARLVEQASLTTMQRSELPTLQRWIESLPPTLVRARPWLALRYAWLLRLNGELKAAEAWLRDAEQAMNAETNSEAPSADSQPPSGSARQFQGEAAALRATLTAAYGDRARTVLLAQEALDHLPSDQALMRGAVTSSLAIVYFQTGDLVAAERAFSETRLLFESVDNVYGAMLAIQGLGQLYMLQGRLRAVSALYQPIVQQARSARGGPAPMLGLAYTGMAELLYEWNDLPTATQYLGAGIDLAERGGLLPIAVIGHVMLARVRQAQGDGAGAHAALAEAEQLVSRGRITPTWLVPPIGVHRARLDVAQGDMQAATHWAMMVGIGPEDDLSSGREFEYLTLARLLLAKGEPDAAERLLKPLLAAAEAGGRIGRAIEILTLLALALRGSSQEIPALDALERALTLATPEGYVRLFVDEGAPMATLVAQIAEFRAQHDPIRAYVERLLRAFPGSEGQGLRTESSDLVEPLSERETQVLRLVASGLSDRAIAEHLFLAIGTVKKHLNNIYSKLGVHTRTQALARARTLNLL